MSDTEGRLDRLEREIADLKRQLQWLLNPATPKGVEPDIEFSLNPLDFGPGAEPSVADFYPSGER